MNHQYIDLVEAVCNSPQSVAIAAAIKNSVRDLDADGSAEFDMAGPLQVLVYESTVCHLLPNGIYEELYRRLVVGRVAQKFPSPLNHHVLVASKKECIERLANALERKLRAQGIELPKPRTELVPPADKSSRATVTSKGEKTSTKTAAKARLSADLLSAFGDALPVSAPPNQAGLSWLINWDETHYLGFGHLTSRTDIFTANRFTNNQVRPMRRDEQIFMGMLPKAVKHDCIVLYYGDTLDEADALVYDCVLNKAKSLAPGAPVFFSVNNLSREIFGRNGSAYNAKIKASLARLAKVTLTVLRRIDNTMGDTVKHIVPPLTESAKSSIDANLKLQNIDLDDFDAGYVRLIEDLRFTGGAGKTPSALKIPEYISQSLSRTTSTILHSKLLTLPAIRDTPLASTLVRYLHSHSSDREISIPSLYARSGLALTGRTEDDCLEMAVQAAETLVAVGVIKPDYQVIRNKRQLIVERIYYGDEMDRPLALIESVPPARKGPGRPRKKA